MIFKNAQFGILALLLIFSHVAIANVTVSDARLWQSPDSTRIVLDVSDVAKYSAFTLENPNRIVIDIKNAKLNYALSKVDTANTPITKIRSATKSDGRLRIVFDLTKVLQLKTFALAPSAPYGHRLVIDLEDPEKTEVVALFDDKLDKRPEKVLEAPQILTPRKFIVAIDAGHGGEDPGAIGPRGTKEKHVTLDIAKKLAALISKEPHMKAILIRSGDYYIPLRKRIALARKENADLFISIHADSFKDNRARGASVFTLSESGASSEAAKWLAQKENRSDILGGVSLDDKDDLLASVLLDLSQTASKALSLEVAENVLGELGSVATLHKSKTERAGFVVLKSPDIPSILVETGFISNPHEESNLSKDRYQGKIASAIMQGVRTYSANRQPALVSITKANTSSLLYTVKRGDTLAKIAQQYDVNVANLKKYNNLGGDTIHVGQKLVIPNA